MPERPFASIAVDDDGVRVARDETDGIRIAWIDLLAVHRSRERWVVVFRDGGGERRVPVLTQDRQTIRDLERRWLEANRREADRRGGFDGTAAPLLTAAESRAQAAVLWVIAGGAALAAAWSGSKTASLWAERDMIEETDRLATLAMMAVVPAAMLLFAIAVACAAWASTRQRTRCAAWREWRVGAEGVVRPNASGQWLPVNLEEARSGGLKADGVPIPLESLSGGRFTRLLFYGRAEHEGVAVRPRRSEGRAGWRLITLWPLIVVAAFFGAARAFGGVEKMWLVLVFGLVLAILGGLLVSMSRQARRDFERDLEDARTLAADLGWYH